MDPSFLDSPTKPAKSPVPPLSALEISGAICARVVHDLSNLVSGIIGNAEYAENSGANPENLKKAVHAISLSANSAGKLLGQCLPLQRLISGEATTCAATEIARRISESSALLPGWHVITASNVAGQLRAQPRWLAATAWQIARETEVARGEIHISCGPAVFPVVWRGSKPNADRPLELFQVTLHYRSEKLLFSTDGSVNPERFGLLAAQELINRFRGQIHARPRPPGRQEISILVPLL